MKGSLPLMLNICQALGLLSNSETDPWLRPSTNSPNNWKDTNVLVVTSNTEKHDKKSIIGVTYKIWMES